MFSRERQSVGAYEAGGGGGQRGSTGGSGLTVSEVPRGTVIQPQAVLPPARSPRARAGWPLAPLPGFHVLDAPRGAAGFFFGVSHFKVLTAPERALCCASLLWL